MTTAMPEVVRAEQLAAREVHEVLDLATAAGEADSTPPLSEHVRLQVRHGGQHPAAHLLARLPDGTLAGYAHLDLSDEVAGPAAELVVHPRHRGRGLGGALAGAAVAAARQHEPRGRLRLWAHGDHPAAAALAARLGFTRSRVLLQMRRSLLAPLPEADLPPGVVVRAFRPGDDDAAWVALNARAFADHPEQGRWTEADLRLRMAEPWFDPAGFLLAEEAADGRLLGFHWTKVHDDATPALGEVYVLGVDPAGHGRGLGRALTVAGLWHLRGRGLVEAMLYVDEENRAAVALYERLGFTRWSTDVSYLRGG